uniref:receptor protein-tyrosine kinase n=1 Tax=Ascaris suum TaxID=6253 RepID=F1KSM7_ASCSU
MNKSNWKPTKDKASIVISEVANVDRITIEGDASSHSKQEAEKMPPKPYDDLFIEPPDDYDVVYGDYNTTMEDGTSTSKRPYIRLNSFLSNVTKNSGQAVRFKCEAAGSPLPLQFTWLKNHAPLEKNRKTKVKNREYWSRLIITDLDVLDSGYYQCVVSNSVASVNTTAVLRVNNAPESISKSGAKLKGKPSRISSFNAGEEDYFDEDIGAGPSMSGGLGRLPNEEDDTDDLWSVPNNAAGRGYAPIPSSDRWLDGMQLRVGDCVLYRGDACSDYLAGRHVLITSESREDIYDIDRNLRAAMMFIDNSPEISADCKQYSHAVACYHMYKVCDRSAASSPRANPNHARILSICRKDCEALQSEVCPKELALAAEHDLVGDDPKALLPKCDSLDASAQYCIPIISPPQQKPSSKNIDVSGSSDEQLLPHWCYVDSGKNYEGTMSTTKSGKRCMNWSQSTSREFNMERYPILRNSKNYCRNPGGKKTSPWCYALPNGQEEYCDVRQCPENIYPHLRDREVLGAADDHGTLLGDISDVWSGVSSHWQLAAVGGVGCIALILLLICCLCCCRRKNKSSGSTSSVMKNGALQSCNGSSVANSAVNNAYYRKLNGTSTPANPNSGAFELSSLLPPHNNNAAFIQHQQTSSSYAQYSPRPSTEPPVEPYQIPEIQPSQLQIGELIGEGQFGVIHSGNWHGSLISGEAVQVAIKSLKPSSNNVDRQNFEEEIRTIASFDHPNVIRLLGVCYFDSQQISAVFEYMVHGDLHDFLRLRAPKTTGYEQSVDQERIAADSEDFLRIAIQIAYGMEYLSSMNYVHRDLATRNCLVGDQRVIKISDFGVTKSCYEKDYYKMLHRTWMPVRWMSKEAIQHGRFSEASDVWAFGVTLWEIYSYGKQPYEGYANSEVIELVSMRSLLECPHNCPTNIYSVMVECWHEHPERRPTFAELHSRLQAWSLTSPTQSVLSHQPNRANSSHSGSSGANRGSRQSSSGQSASLIRGGGGGNTSVGTGPSLSNTAFSVPSPAPMQTMMTLNGVHPFHNAQVGW